MDPLKQTISENAGARESLESLRSIQTVMVVGAGWVGRQIVGQLAAHHVSVWWLDRSEDAMQSGLQWIESHCLDLARDGYWPNDLDKARLLSSIHPIGSLDDYDGAIDLVLETVTEQISIKRKVLQAASSRFPDETIIASNSSYFTPSMLERYVSAPGRFAHWHFHVPVWRTRLVDIASGTNTHPSVLLRLQSLSHRIGQKSLVQTVENPGYIFNWLLKSLLQSSLQLWTRGVATPDQIDLAWKQVTEMPLGPFGMMDQIGLDLIHQTMSAARFVDGDTVWQPLIDQLQPYIDTNRLGVKTGAGIYDYRSPSPENVVADSLKRNP